MWIKRVSKTIFGNLRFWTYSFFFKIYICFALRFCICIFCAFMISFFCIFFLRLLFVCILGSIFDIFCIACCIFSRFKISRISPQGADTTNRIFRFDSVILDPVQSPGAELKALGFEVGVIKLLDFRPWIQRKKSQKKRLNEHLNMNLLNFTNGYDPLVLVRLSCCFTSGGLVWEVRCWSRIETNISIYQQHVPW